MPVADADVPDADIVLATWWGTAPWVAALSPRKGAKAIFLQGYETSPGEFHPEMDAAWRLPLRKIVVASWLATLAKERFGDANVHLVPNSVDTGQFHAPERGKQARPTVGMLYTTFHAKGADVSLAALRTRAPAPAGAARAGIRRRAGFAAVAAARLDRVPLPPDAGGDTAPLCPMRRLAVRQPARGIPPAGAGGDGLPLPGGLDAHGRPAGLHRGRRERIAGRCGRRSRALAEQLFAISWSGGSALEAHVGRRARHRAGLHLGRRHHAARGRARRDRGEQAACTDKHEEHARHDHPDVPQRGAGRGRAVHRAARTASIRRTVRAADGVPRAERRVVPLSRAGGRRSPPAARRPRARCASPSTTATATT